MRPLVAISTLAPLALALALAGLWSRRGPLTASAPAPAPDHIHESPLIRTTQRAALARIITTLDKLGEYALGVDVNGALVVEMMSRSGDSCDWADDNTTFCFDDTDSTIQPDQDGSDVDGCHQDWFGEDDDIWDEEENEHTALDAEADLIDSYLGPVAHVSGPIAHTPDDILAAGLSPRPYRFPSVAAAREWFPGVPSSLMGLKDWEYFRKARDAFHAGYEKYQGNFDSPGWRDVKRNHVKAIIDCMDQTDTVYELSVTDWGTLAICTFGSDRFGQQSRALALDPDLDEYQTEAFSDAISCMLSRHVTTVVVRGCDGRRVKRGVGGRGRYDPDDVLAAGLVLN